MNKVTMIFLVITSVYSQFNWQDNGVKVRQGIHIEWQRTATEGNEGEVIFVWSDTRDGGRDIYAQKVDVTGNYLWGEKGAPVVVAPGRQEDPIAISDGSGGVYIAWIDYRYEPDKGDVFAQHVLSDRSLDWDEEGVPLSTLSGVQESLNMCADGLGGAFVIWNDKSETSSLSGFTYATHLSPSGEIVAPNVGVPIITSDGEHSKVSIEVGGEGFAVMVWEDTRISEEIDIYAQKIDINCVTQWSEPANGGIALCTIQNAEQVAPKVTHVTGDTTVVVWEDYRNSSISGDVYIQYLDGNGNNLLEDDGFPLCTNPFKQSKPRVKANAEVAFIVWEDFRNHPLYADIYAQSFTLQDSVLWDDDGKPISIAARKQTQPRLTTDGFGGIYFVWMDERNADYPETEIYLQHVTENGTISFSMDGLPICEAPSYQFNPLVRKDGSGGAFIIWGDQRSGSIGLYVQHAGPSSGITFSENGEEFYYGMDGDAITPNSLYLGNDKALIYWQDYRGGGEHPQIYGQIITADFNELGEYNGVKLSENSNQSKPEAVKVSDHIFLNYQSTNESGALAQYYQILDLNLNMIGDSSGLQIYENPYDFNQEYAEVMTGEDGYVYLAFSDIRLWDYDVYVQKYDELGNPQWADGGVLVSELANDDIVQSVTPMPGGGCVVIWFGGEWNDLNVYAQAFDGNGQIADGWASEPMNISAAPGYQDNVRTTTTDDGIFIVWRDTRNGNADIFGQLINYNGNVIGAANGFPVVEKENDQLNPTLTYNSFLDNLLVCWEDFETGYDYNLICKSIDADSLIGSTEILVAGESGDQISPFVFVTQNGTYLMIWEDTRSGGSSDVYYQALDTSGFLYEDGGIVVCEKSFSQQLPGINLLSETENLYLLLWVDLRSSGKEFLRNIYAQSVSLATVNTVKDRMIPETFFVFQNYPNPFNPITTIRYDLPERSQVTVVIYDIMGKRVKQLLNATQAAGNKSVVWDGTDNNGRSTSAGVYFYRIQAGKSTQVRKMVLMK